MLRPSDEHLRMIAAGEMKPNGQHIYAMTTELLELRALHPERDPDFKKRQADWIIAAMEAIVTTAGKYAEFTTTEIWDELQRRSTPPPPDPRALATALSRCRWAGVIEPSNRYRSGGGPNSNARQVRIWISKVHHVAH